MPPQWPRQGHKSFILIQFPPLLKFVSFLALNCPILPGACPLLHSKCIRKMSTNSTLLFFRHTPNPFALLNLRDTKPQVTHKAHMPCPHFTTHPVCANDKFLGTWILHETVVGIVSTCLRHFTTSVCQVNIRYVFLMRPFPNQLPQHRWRSFDVYPFTNRGHSVPKRLYSRLHCLLPLLRYVFQLSHPLYSHKWALCMTPTPLRTCPLEWGREVVSWSLRRSWKLRY